MNDLELAAKLRSSICKVVVYGPLRTGYKLRADPLIVEEVANELERRHMKAAFSKKGKTD